MLEAYRNLIKPSRAKTYILVVIILIVYCCVYRLWIIRKINQYEAFQNNNNTKELNNKLEKRISMRKKLKVTKQKQSDNTKKMSSNIDKSKDDKLSEDVRIKAYNKAYQRYLDIKKENVTNIDLLSVGEDIESGMINLLEEVGNTWSGKKNESIVENFRNKSSNKSSSVSALNNYVSTLNNNNATSNNNNATSNNNNATSNNDTSLNKSVTLNQRLNKVMGNENNTDNNTKNNKGNGSITDFVDYTLKTIQSFMDNYGTVYLGKFKNIANVITKEENMVPAGVLLIIISMGLYFIDISS